ncbi:MAG TPA: class I SAM-dependent methyltransferase [Bacteroidota bacterium]|nr:class I SAM-dependent methyltransferase [Bacteroidota bacterium]
MIDSLRKMVNSIPFYRRLKNFFQYPPGHYYSPIPSLRDIRRSDARIFEEKPNNIPGIDLNTDVQLQLFDDLSKWYETLPFKEHKTDGLRYFYENSFFSYADAIILFCMIRHLHPRRIIEVGSGFSSCVMLDTNELFFDNEISCSFIEPYPERLISLITPQDHGRVTILPRRVQDVDLKLFATLQPNDILFIDSSHVSKIDSDVNHLVFNILPAIASGVHIHFHDILYPFEYSRQWVYSGLFWNESYLLRAFLQYNTSFKITLFNSYLAQFYREELLNRMPLCLRNTGGSIWLQKCTP